MSAFAGVAKGASQSVFVQICTSSVSSLTCISSKAHVQNAIPLQAVHWIALFTVKDFGFQTQTLSCLVFADQNAAAAHEEAGPSSSSSVPQTNGIPSSNLKISDEDQQQLFDDDDDDDEDLGDDDGDMSDEEVDQLQASIHKSSLH